VRIAVISDLHLGREAATERLGHDDAEFVRFLRFLEGDHEQIVLLGDIYETLTAPHPRRVREELFAVQAAHAELSAQLRRPMYRYVAGNHDAVAVSALGALPEIVCELDGLRLVFVHGHLHDWLIRRARLLPMASVWAGGWLRRIGMGRLYRSIDALDPILRGARPQPERCHFQRWAFAQARARGADVFVSAHSHQGRCVRQDGRVYMNSGTCMGGRFEFLSLDTRTASLRHCTSW
jgi:predicted phosphodiesterase